MAEGRFGVDEKFEIPDAWWRRIEPLIPTLRPKKRSGRPRRDDRQALTAILFVSRTGCQWNALPRSLGASSTVHDRFQEWARAGFFQKLWESGLREYDQERGIDWSWQAMDGAMTKAPLGGKKHRPKSYGPRQAGKQAESAHRGSGHSNRDRR